MASERETKTEKAQIAWTLLVALGVAFAAIHQLQSPRSTIAALQAAEPVAAPADENRPAPSRTEGRRSPAALYSPTFQAR